MITCGSAFSGAIDGMSLVFLQAGYDINVANEIDSSAVKTVWLTINTK